MGGIFGKPKKKKPGAGGVKISSGGVSMDPKDYPAFKLLMIGDPSVGKSSLLIRYADDEFTDNFISTIGVDYKEKEVRIRNDDITIQIWDTAGQERFRTITSSYYRAAHGMLLVFDLTNAASFKSVSKWVQEVDRYAEDYVVVILVGNKGDADNRVVTAEQIEEVRMKHGLEYVETSAKDGSGVGEVFMKLTEQVVERYNNEL